MIHFWQQKNKRFYHHKCDSARNIETKSNAFPIPGNALFDERMEKEAGVKDRIQINTEKMKFQVAPELYGLFFEDINRAADGGLYPEMIRNRAFEDSLLPEGCTTDENQKIFITEHKWPGAFHHGEGMDEWAELVPETPVPGWYTECAKMELVTTDTLNPNRKAALKVEFEAGGRISNIGYGGMSVQKGNIYHFYFMIRNRNKCHFIFELAGEKGEKLGKENVIADASSEYQKLECEIMAVGTDDKARLNVICEDNCCVLFGFTSLMPQKTFCGHGLREDLAIALKNTHAKFIRFPGGCVVEGINEQNALRFSRTIGPVWERPGCQLMWHYRSTNGLGFHEYLQLCEDLEMEAMYVCNCGMDCQARHGGGFTEELVDEYLQEALNALEYALGDVTTKYGTMRAEAGHPEPFRLKYMEIGNENWGSEYLERYEKFYSTLKKAYPDVIYISNTHTEQAGLPTEIVDEHYYNTPEFFLENTGLFEKRDRKGPDIFIGEYAVNGGDTIASMECALAEAAFLTEVENNQDLVKLSAYAPLFQNAGYTAWKPNLIVFNNHQVYGIPSYHVLSLFGKYRGTDVVECRVEGEYEPPVYHGIPGIMCGEEGLLYRNVKINGESVELNRMVYGTAVEEKDGIRMKPGGKRHRYTGKCHEWNEAFEKFQADGPFGQERSIWGVFGQEELTEYTFEAELKFDRETPVTLSVWNFRPDTDAGCNEPKDTEWNLRSVRNQIWKLDRGMSMTRQPGAFDEPLNESERTPVNIDFAKYNRYKIVARCDGYDCYINDVLADKKEFRRHPLIYSVASTDRENIYLKLVSVAGEEKKLDIELDRAVEENIEVEVISAGTEECNSFEQPLRVAPRKESLKACGQRFSYNAPPGSVSVLKMKKAESIRS